MPKIRDIPGPYRFFFYSFDFNEPVHVHVRREKKTCKFWLEPLELASNDGFSASELNNIRRYINAHYDTILEAWYEHGGWHGGSNPRHQGDSRHHYGVPRGWASDQCAPGLVVAAIRGHARPTRQL